MKQKTILLVLILFSSAVAVYAQGKNRFDPEKEKREINGYTIRLVPLPGNTFGFFVMKGNRPVYQQLTNPVNRTQMGFKSKEDAFKLAEWVTAENAKDPKKHLQVTPSVAKQLNISQQ